MVEENTDFRESTAFKEYSTSTRSKIKTPWLAIIIVAIVTATAHLVTAIFATAVLDNAWALNFLIGLYGLPAGFFIAFKNKTLSALVSIQYSSFSAMIYTGIYMIVTFIIYFINPNISTGRLLGNIVGVLLTSLVIGLYQVLMFGTGALIGTFAFGVIDDRRK